MGKKTSYKSHSKGSTELHQAVVKKTLINVTCDHCRAWANNTGAVKTADGRFVKFGLKGSSDILGIYKGLFLAIEIKTGNAVQSKYQKNFEKMVCNMGGIYILITDKNVEHVLEIVEQKYKEVFCEGFKEKFEIAAI